jgi:hypothetical protein
LYRLGPTESDAHAPGCRLPLEARPHVSGLLPRALMTRAAGRDAVRRHRSVLPQCKGFRVWTPQGKLGVVEHVLLEEWGEPRELVVRRGRFRRRRTTLAASDVSVVDMARQSVFADVRAGFERPVASSAALDEIPR